jgi:hypothetical protein
VPEAGVVGSVAPGGESSKKESPPTWSEDFDLIAFVAEILNGNLCRLETLSLEELRKLAVESGLKCLALNQMVFACQEKEVAERLEQEVEATKEGLRKTHTDALLKKKVDFEKSLAKEEKRYCVL